MVNRSQNVRRRSDQTLISSLSLVFIVFVFIELPVAYLLHIYYLSEYGVGIDKSGISEKTSIYLPDSARLVYGRYYPVRDPKVLAIVDLSNTNLDSFLAKLPAKMELYRYDKHVPASNDSGAYLDYETARLQASLHVIFRQGKTWRCPTFGKRFVYGEHRTNLTDYHMSFVHLLIVFDNHGKRLMYLSWLST